MGKRVYILRYAAIAALLWCLLACPAASASEEQAWWDISDDGSVTVHLYFFWTDTCPHCRAARPDMARIAAEMPWVTLHSMSLSGDRDNGRRYAAMARSIGERAQSVPAFIFCGQMRTGYDSTAGMGAILRRELAACRAAVLRDEDPATSAEMPQRETPVPGLARFDLEQWSLPLVTVTLAAMDSFNPCAFFVLLFLLSLLVHARSRARMLLVGGVFVGISGLLYFLFLGAWLNVFLLLGQMFWLTLGAGVVALLVGLVNVKDFFFFQRGASLSMTEHQRQGLIARMRGLLAQQRLWPVLAATAALGLVANTYELLCTAGFPMVFTRILTLHELSLPAYVAYLALYCVIYVVPLFVIVTVFAVTLGQRKLSSDEGRLLKLMSGLMMTGLGLILMFAPSLLNQVGTTLVLLAAVLAISAAGRRWLRSTTRNSAGKSERNAARNSARNSAKNSARLSKAPDDR